MLGRVVALSIALVLPAAHAGQRLSLRHVALDLPGPPAKVISSDVNQDGRRDLVIVSTYTEVETIGEERMEHLISVATAIPALFNRREVRLYLAQPDGTHALAGPPLSLAASVLHLEAGPPGLPLVALTDEGLSRCVHAPDGGESPLRLEPLIAERPVLRGSGAFFATLSLVHELNGDGIADLLLPAEDSLAVYLGTGSGLSPAPAERIAMNESELPASNGIRRSYPMPEVIEFDGDRVPDLAFPFRDDSPAPRHVLLGSREGRFRTLRREARDCHDRLTDVRMQQVAAGAAPWPENLVALEDIDGDGRAEAVFAESLGRGEGFRAGMKDAKKPIGRYRFHELAQDGSIQPEPYFTTQVIGHVFAGPLGEAPFESQSFVDLDGDGRKDLVTLTLDFSVFQALKILVAKRIGIEVNFHVYAQHADGSFAEVPGLDLAEKLKLDLNQLELRRCAQFAGDFDGDGRQDCAHFGRGRRLTLHAGQPGCRYPKKPDLSIALDEQPASLDLIKVADLDGDGRSDLQITRLLPHSDPDTSPAVRLDLYLSGAAK